MQGQKAHRSVHLLNNSLKRKEILEKVLFIQYVSTPFYCVFVWNQSFLTMTFCLLLVYWFWCLHRPVWHFSTSLLYAQLVLLSFIFNPHPHFQNYDQDYRYKTSDASILSCNIYSLVRIFQMNVFIHYVCRYHESGWHNDWRLIAEEFFQHPHHSDLSGALFLAVINISSKTATLQW